MLSGDEVELIPLVGRETGDEAGYYLYESVDGGSTYLKIADVSVFNPHGIIDNYYPKTENIDDSSTGLLVTFDSDDANEIEMSEFKHTMRECFINCRMVAFETQKIVQELESEVEQIFLKFMP